VLSNEKPLNGIITDSKKRLNLESRFWSKVEIKGENQCWEWKSKAAHDFGYGRMSFGRKIQLKAHQISWALKNGPIPSGQSILHKCDNPKCCNPNHLFLGTQKANMVDAITKGRHRPPPVFSGVKHPRACFDEKQVASIKSSNLKNVELAMRFGVSERTIRRVKNEQTYKEASV
jgi:hypothetical protein